MSEPSMGSLVGAMVRDVPGVAVSERAVAVTRIPSTSSDALAPSVSMLATAEFPVCGVPNGAVPAVLPSELQDAATRHRTVKGATSMRNDDIVHPI